jgi:hypothetical protein
MLRQHRFDAVVPAVAASLPNYFQELIEDSPGVADNGNIDKEQRLWVNIDWSKTPKGNANGSVKIAGASAEVSVKVNSFNPPDLTRDSLEGFVEADGYVSIEAEHYTNKVDAGQVGWQKIDDYGRTLSSMTIFPVTAKSVTPPTNSPCLEYKMYLFNPGSITVESYLAPSLNFFASKGLQFAMSFDDQPPQIINFVSKDYAVAYSNNDWQDSVRNGVRTVKSTHTLTDAGYHTLKVWMVDPGVVLEKIVVNTGGVKPSYLGPPESYRSSGKI